MVGLRGVRSAWAQSCLGTWLILAVAGYASANPMMVPPASTVTQGLYTLFISNLPIDILLFSALFLLVLWKLKSPIRTAHRDANKLVAQIVIGGVVIAIIGALIDFYSFFTYSEGTRTASAGYYHVYPMTVEVYAVAAAAVFVSVCAVSLAITRARLIPALLVAATVTVFNLLAWTIWDYGYILKDGEGIVAIAGVAFLFVPPILFKIARLHKMGVQS